MKKMNNKKGFTLIELLAVIVILAILVAAAVPAISSYLETARNKSFANDAKTVMKAVKSEVMRAEAAGETWAALADNEVSLAEMNEVLDTKLNKSPFGNAYLATSKIVVPASGEYTIYLSDGSYQIGTSAAPINETTLASTSAPTAV